MDTLDADLDARRRMANAQLQRKVLASDARSDIRARGSRKDPTTNALGASLDALADDN